MSVTPTIPTLKTVNAFFKTAFASNGHTRPLITHFEPDFAGLSLEISDYHMRPGEYVSGPTQMALADHAAYIVIFTRLGLTPMAVTSNLSIDFLRPCKGKVVTAQARLIKLGRSLASIHVDIRGQGQDKMSSHAVVTYALPPKG